MTERALPPRSTGRIAIGTGVIGILALLFLILFFAVGEPFGTLNDVSSGLLAVAGAILASLLYAEHRKKSLPAGNIGLLLALIGAGVVIVGSVLVIFKFTGWLLAGFYSAVGYALIGGWLALFCSNMLRASAFPRRLLTFGWITGLLMAFGLMGLVGITAGIDSMESMAWYLNIVYVGNLGSLLYLIWTIWLGRVLLVR